MPRVWRIWLFEPSFGGYEPRQHFWGNCFIGGLQWVFMGAEFERLSSDFLAARNVPTIHFPQIGALYWVFLPTSIWAEGDEVGDLWADNFAIHMVHAEREGHPDLSEMALVPLNVEDSPPREEDHLRGLPAGELVPLEEGDTIFEDAIGEEPECAPPPYEVCMQDTEMAWEEDPPSSWEGHDGQSAEHGSDPSPPHKIQCRERVEQPGEMER